MHAAAPRQGNIIRVFRGERTAEQLREEIPMTHEEPTRQAGTTQSATPNETYYLHRGKRQAPNRRSLGVALIVVGLIWLVTTWTPDIRPFPFGSNSSATLVDRTFAATQLVLDAGSADVELIRGSGADIRIEAIRDGGSDSDFTVNVVEDGAALRVNHTAAPCLIFCNRSLSYRITLPSETQAEIQTFSGNIFAENVASPITVRTISGDLELSGMTGMLKANTTSGDITLEGSNLTGAVIETTSGDVDLEGVAQNIQVKTVSGDIDIIDAREGQIELTTISGDIAYNGSLARETQNRVTSVSGNVQVWLPYDTSLQLDASSVSGQTDTDFELTGTTEERTLRGNIGSGTIPLTIKTTSGDVEVNQQ
jgi:Putative adhesin